MNNHENETLFSSGGGRLVDSSTLFSKKYDGSENCMTIAFLQVLHAGGLPLLKYLCEELDMPFPDPYFQILTQKNIGNVLDTHHKVICDGLLTMTPFQLIVESKIRINSIDLEQLEAYEDIIEHWKLGADTALLYLTPDKDVPERLNNSVAAWCNWNELFNILDKYPNKDNQLDALNTGLRGLWDEISGNSHSIPNKDKVAILAGRFGYPLAVKESIYHCQRGRRFGGAKYFAFYAGKQIEKVFEVVEGPIKHDSKRWPGKPVSDDYYILKEVPDIISIPIINKEQNKRGRILPFTQGQPRYVHIETLKKAKDISELKQLNNLK